MLSFEPNILLSREDLSRTLLFVRNVLKDFKLIEFLSSSNSLAFQSIKESTFTIRESDFYVPSIFVLDIVSTVEMAKQIKTNLFNYKELLSTISVRDESLTVSSELYEKRESIKNYKVVTTKFNDIVLCESAQEGKLALIRFYLENFTFITQEDII